MCFSEGIKDIQKVSVYDLTLFSGMMMMAISLHLHAAKELFMKQLQS